MNFLQKILLIAIVSVFAGNTEGMIGAALPPSPPLPSPPVASPILDLPMRIGGTPGLHMISGGAHPVLIAKSVNNQNANCLHIIVPGTVAATKGIHARDFDGNIYFPTNGVQPTTPEAVEYSCANVDNRENSPITDWYMQMFGVMPFQNTRNPANDYIKAGWKNFKWKDIQGNNGPVSLRIRIISFDVSVDDTMVNDPNIPGATISRRALFEREFRKIASTSVGRVLLYRILIEIRRYKNNNKGCTELPIVLSDSGISARNTCRNLRIVYEDGNFAFRPQGELAFSNAIADETVVGSAVRGTGYSKVILCPDTVSVSLFHEMLHWYHHLRNIDRMVREAGKRPDIKYNFNTHFLGKYYWGGLNSCANKWQGLSVSEQPWLASGLFGLKDYVNIEELRTVLGVTYCGSIEQYQQNYLQGDDLSENLYRICVGVPLRFGYGHDCFCEDTKVIDRVMNSCLKNFLLYSKAYDPGNFNPDMGRSGLGKSRFP